MKLSIDSEGHSENGLKVDLKEIDMRGRIVDRTIEQITMIETKISMQNEVVMINIKVQELIAAAMTKMIKTLGGTGLLPKKSKTTPNLVANLITKAVENKGCRGHKTAGSVILDTKLNHEIINGTTGMTGTTTKTQNVGPKMAQ